MTEPNNQSNGSVGEVLTIEEMEERFDSEWILIGDPEMEDGPRVLGGTVLARSRNRDDIYQTANELRPKFFAIHYTGRIPDDVAVIL